MRLVLLNLSTRPEKRVGSDEIWDAVGAVVGKTRSMRNRLALGICYQARVRFTAPKLSVTLKDCMGRILQCGTIQVDFNTPGRLGASYVAEDSSRKEPVMLHRAILGSFERFIGVLIEHYEGAFPSWLAPEQAVILNITDKQADYVREVEAKLAAKGIRVSSDLRNEKVGFKIREHAMQKVPYLLVVGDKEVDSGSVAVRTRGGEDLGVMTVDDFCSHLSDDVALFGRTRSAS